MAEGHYRRKREAPLTVEERPSTLSGPLLGTSKWQGTGCRAKRYGNPLTFRDRLAGIWHLCGPPAGRSRWPPIWSRDYGPGLVSAGWPGRAAGEVPQAGGGEGDLVDEHVGEVSRVNVAVVAEEAARCSLRRLLLRRAGRVR